MGKRSSAGENQKYVWEVESQKTQWGAWAERRGGVSVGDKKRRHCLQRWGLFFQAGLLWWRSEIRAGRCGLRVGKRSLQRSTLWNTWAACPTFSPSPTPIFVHTTQQTDLSKGCGNLFENQIQSNLSIKTSDYWEEQNIMKGAGMHEPTMVCIMNA